MRRRVNGSVPPPALLVFDGRHFRTTREWESAFADFHAARARWREERGLERGDMPDYTVVGDCPFDGTGV